MNQSNENTGINKISKVMVNSSDYGSPCGWTSLYAHSPGHVLLHASISSEHRHLDHSRHVSVILKATKRLAAYPPLIVAQASDGNQYGGYWLNLSLRESQNQLYNVKTLFLVPESQMNLQLLGGPDQWDKEIDFIEDVEILGNEITNRKDGLRVHRNPGIAGLYRIHCRSLGTFVCYLLLDEFEFLFLIFPWVWHSVLLIFI